MIIKNFFFEDREVHLCNLKLHIPGTFTVHENEVEYKKLCFEFIQ